MLTEREKKLIDCIQMCIVKEEQEVLAGVGNFCLGLDDQPEAEEVKEEPTASDDTRRMNLLESCDLDVVKGSSGWIVRGGVCQGFVKVAKSLREAIDAAEQAIEEGADA